MDMIRQVYAPAALKLSNNSLVYGCSKLEGGDGQQRQSAGFGEEKFLAVVGNRTAIHWLSIS